MKFVTKPIRHYPPHLRRVATLPWKLKIQISGRLSTVLVSHKVFSSFLAPRIQRFSGNSSVNFVAVYPFKYQLFKIKTLSSSLNTMLIVDKHCSDVCCDEFSVPQLIAKVNNQKNSDMKSFICNQYGERHPIFKLKNIKILSSSLNTMMIVHKRCSGFCCDEFPVPQIDRQNKQVKEQ